MGQRPGSSTKNWLRTGLMLQSSKRANMVRRWRTCNRDVLKAEDGVKYFRDKLSPFCQKSLQCFPLEILLIYSCKEREHWKGRLDWKIWFAVKTRKRFMDGHVSFVIYDRTAKGDSIQADIAWLNAENHATLDPHVAGTRDNWCATQVTTHERPFPFCENLTTLMFIVTMWS